MAAKSECGVRVVMGTMTMGPAIGDDHSDQKHTLLPSFCQTPPDVALAQLNALVSCGIAGNKQGPEAGKWMIDTASAYQNWETERTLGAILSAQPELRSKLSIHTKANSMQKPFKCLSRESVLYQAHGSLERLGVDFVDIYYLHGPDITTPIEETLCAIDELHRDGKIVEFGLSNYPAWKVVDIFYRCKAKGMVLPTVYQGCYNAITRSIEAEAMAAFRELGIRSYHYNPLAGGLLTGKYNGLDSSLRDGGRFGKASPISGAMYSQRYWKQHYFDALEIIRVACAAEAVPMAEAALRWIMHHSVLSSKHNDGIILGASTLAHAESNLAACAKGPLSQAIVSAYDRAWAVTRPISTGPLYQNPCVHTRSRDLLICVLLYCMYFMQYF